jgi:hypothetical protein
VRGHPSREGESCSCLVALNRRSSSHLATSHRHVAALDCKVLASASSSPANGKRPCPCPCSSQAAPPCHTYRATVSSCVVTTPARPRRCVRVVARPVRPFVERALGARHTHIPAHTHTKPHGPELHRIWPPHQIQRETNERGPPTGGARGAAPRPALSEREGGKRMDHGPAC